jgi:AraC family transcriptional regulator, regulatory protein of adaptative response / methylphosphotriester-DNA alkyltransferase methyltransferase
MPTITDKPAVISARKKEIFADYIAQLDQHIADLKEGKVTRAFEIRDLAALLHVHPVHLSNTIKEVTGKSTCSFYEERLLQISKELLLTTRLPVAQIAIRLTYDPSNFTKFFKAYTGTTPKKFRDAHQNV